MIINKTCRCDFYQWMTKTLDSYFLYGNIDVLLESISCFIYVIDNSYEFINEKRTSYEQEEKNILIVVSSILGL